MWQDIKVDYSTDHRNVHLVLWLAFYFIHFSFLLNPFGIRNYVDKMANFNERLSLQWNDFKDNVSSAFGDFRSPTMNMIQWSFKSLVNVLDDSWPWKMITNLTISSSLTNFVDHRSCPRNDLSLELQFLSQLVAPTRSFSFSNQFHFYNSYLNLKY